MRPYTIRGDVIGYKGIEVWSDARQGASRLGHLTGGFIDLDAGPSAWPDSITLFMPDGQLREFRVQLRDLRLTSGALEATDKTELIMSLVIPRYAHDHWDLDTQEMVFTWPAITVDSAGYSDLFDLIEFHLLPQPESEDEDR